MHQQQQEVRQVSHAQLHGTKKRRVMTQELIGKFRSKSDFIKYFSESLQLYLPPDKMVNKDFIKQVRADKKKLRAINEVNYVNMPRYDELSVKKFWPILQSDEEFMLYMPDPGDKGQLPERTYFWNVANTVQHLYVQNLITHDNN